MNRLARIGSLERREVGIVAGATLAALGLLVMAVRAQEPDPWGNGAIFALEVAAVAVVALLGLGAGPASGAPRPGLIALASLLAIPALAALSMWLDATPDTALRALWIAATTAAFSVFLWKRTRGTFPLLIAGIAGVVAWTALWDEILSGGIAAHLTVYRVVLIVAALALLGASRLVSDEDGPELLTGAALAAVYGVGLGAISLVFSVPFFLATPQGSPLPELALPSNSGAWQTADLLVTLAALSGAVRTGSRELGIVGAFSLVVFVLATGFHSFITLPAAHHEVLFWPLALIVTGAAMTVVGLRRTQERRDEPLAGLAAIGGIVFAAGMYAVLMRRATTDTDFETFLYALIAELGLLATLAALRRSRPSWAVAPVATTVVLLTPAMLAFFLNWVDSTPDGSFSVFWIFALSALLGLAAFRLTGARFPLLLAGLFAIASYSGACAWLLPDGIAGTTTAYRLLLLPLAAAIAFAGFRVAASARDGRTSLRVGPPGSELLAVAALAVLIAFGYGAVVIESGSSVPAFGVLQTGQSSLIWDILLVAAAVGTLVVASASGSRVIGVAAGIGLALALATLGKNISGDFQTAGRILVWPLLLILVGLALAAPGVRRARPD